MTACKDAKLILVQVAATHVRNKKKTYKARISPSIVLLYLMHISWKPTAEFKRRATFKIIHSKRNAGQYWTIQIKDTI